MGVEPISPQPSPELISLHRYFVHANRLREYFASALANPEWLELAKLAGGGGNPMAATLAFMLHDPGIFMSYWYGNLYVVVEGWKELKLSDSAVDRLLASPNVDLLRRYRNGVFHFQKNYFDERTADFFAAESTVPWVHDLTNAFGDYFRRLAGATWPELSQEFRHKFRDIKTSDEELHSMLRRLLLQ